MARRERERYTERNRPMRKETGTRPPGGGGAQAQESPWNNPIVWVAVAGLALAVVLALGFLVGRGKPTETAGAGTGTPAAEGTPAATVDQGIALSTTEVVTEATATSIPADVLSLPGEGTPYAAPEDQNLDAAGKSYFLTIETEKGPILVELWPEIAPRTVNSMVFLTREGFYDGLTFHRVEDWVVQGGDPAGDGSGGPGYLLPAEFNAENPVPHSYGTLAMARTMDPNSAGSQFYFVKDPGAAQHLNGQYTVFGHVVSGMDVVNQLAVGDKMTKVTIEEKDKAESQVSPDDVRAGKLPETPGQEATQ